jgi:hypothetical protein
MKLLLILFSCFITISCYAKTLGVSTLTKDKTNLKDYGFAYCLSKTKDTHLNKETSLALNAYFQKGNHDEPAYENLRKYINSYLSKKTSIYQDTEMPARLIHCLDMYNLPEYNRLITKQDGYRIK